MKLDFKDSPNIIMVLGFTMMMLLMLALGFVGLTRMANIYLHMEQIVKDRNVKTEYAQVMKDALRERALLMHSINLLSDPFDQDDEYIEFNKKGALYADTRRELESMTLSKGEKSILKEIRSLTLNTQPLVTMAVDAALNNNRIEAQTLVRTETMPAQKAIAYELDKLIRLEYAESEQAWFQAADSYRSARLLMFGLIAALTLLGFLIAFLVIRHVQRQADSLRHQAMFDTLTKMPNRSLFADRIQQTISISRRENKSFAIIGVDLNRFKEINDSLGHHVGDQVLQQVAERSHDCLRPSDTFARMGGDEFTVLLPNTPNEEDAIVVAKKILAAINMPVETSGQSLKVGASLGIALFPVHGDNDKSLLRSADTAMYEAKRRQSGYIVYSAELYQDAKDSMKLQNDLRNAIEQHQLVLHYQPKIDLSSGCVTGVEALVRWQHPVRGLLHPEVFIDLAENTGLIKPLTMEVLQMALKQGEVWYKSGLDLTVAVNISTLNILDPEFPDQLEDLLKEFSIPVTQLELEIIESAIMTGTVRAVENIKRLNALGLEIAIDDFGAGYSSMSHLKELLVTQIKIDESFVKDMAVNNNYAVIVRSTIELGHSLGMKVIAEGVEDLVVLDQLKSLGCDYAQGYYLGHPMTGEKLHPWLSESTWGYAELPPV